MRCSKCNSPLISGEPFCKICGTKVEDMPKSEDLEVIDFDMFDDEESEIETVVSADGFDHEENYDLMDELEDAKLESTIDLKPVSLDEIKNTPVEEDIPAEEDIPVIVEKVEEEPKTMDIDLEDDEKPEMSQTLIDIMMKPIVLEDTIKLNQEKIDELLDNEETKEEVKEEVVPEVKEEAKEEEPLPEEKTVFKKEDKKVKKEIKSKEHDTSARTVKSLKQGKDGAGLTIVILAVILIVSIVLNIYLFITSGNKETTGDEGGATIVKTNKVVFDKYEINVDNGWIISNLDNNLILSDTSNEWMSKTIIVDEASYKEFVKNTDDFIDDMKEQKYQFTSNYEKKIDNTKFYLFKGKYESYTTFIVVGAIDKDVLSVTEVKFENEVNDKTLEKIMTTINSIELNNIEYETLDVDGISEIVKKHGEPVKEDKTDKDDTKDTEDEE